MHGIRVRADHWDDLLSKEEAERQLARAKEIVNKVSLAMSNEDLDARS